MSPRIRRLVVTLIVLGLAVGVVLIMVLSPGSDAPPQTTPAADQARIETQTETAGDAIEAQDPSPRPPEPDRTAGPPADLGELHAVWVDHGGTTPQPLGSLDPDQAKLLIEFSPAGAGFERVTLSEFWQTAASHRQADAHYAARRRGDPSPPPLPAASERYVLQTAQPLIVPDPATGALVEVPVPILAADTIVINGQSIRLSNQYTDDQGSRWTFWRETGPGAFEALIVDADEKPVARITRSFAIRVNYDITAAQRVVNLAGGTLDVLWKQYGPGELTEDRSRYMDRRRVRFGYLPDPVGLPDLVASNDNDLWFERQNILKRGQKAEKITNPAERTEMLTLWPNEVSLDNGFALSWFAATNRYFALAVHPALGAPAVGSRSLEPVVEFVRFEISGGRVFSALNSPAKSVPPGGEAVFDMGVYAGPLDRRILGTQDPMAALRMKGLILYQMSSFCGMCTFQWLAKLLLAFLSGVHSITFDWGISIIILVLIVRTLLHPLTKKAQVNMQKFGKVMSDLKPEIDRLQKKYKDDPRKLQQEQMRMMRERGVNPFQMLGCLPMFLQMPIWVALYAMLYFALELRHEPAFWGIFQRFGGWPFLGDLSAADHCLWEFQQPFRFLMWNVTGINVLPLLMGLVFFFQQKYMSPPPSPTMTKEQIQQQKIMKVMMVVLFPVMLYSAPSGLTLYIFTSSTIGIIESRYIRQHVKDMDLKPAPKARPKKKPRDPQARAFAEAMDRAKSKRKQPPKKYKKRK